MQTIRFLVLCLSFAALGCAPDGDPVTNSSKKLVQQTPLYFQVEHSLSLNAVAKRIRSSMSDAQGVPPRVFVEFVPDYKTKGVFSLKNKYASLSMLATDLAGQEAKYAWEAVGDTLFVYPNQQGFLTRKVGATSFIARSFCGVIERLSLLVNSDLKEADILSCMYKGGAPQFTTDIPGSVFTNTVLGEPEGKAFTVQVSKSDRVLDVVMQVVIQENLRFGASIGALVTGMPPTWILKF